MDTDFDISNVRDALSAFNRSISSIHKKLFKGIFNTLETGLSKLGENAASQTKAARGIIHLINAIPMNAKQDYDVLGFIYEYLIGMFAANAGKKAGEFYTPNEVSLLMSEIIANHVKDRKEIQIYDPTSGSGSLLINIGQCVAPYLNDKDNIKYYAQELKQNTYNLTRMNLIMRGIKPSNIYTRNADTLEQDWPYFDENDPENTYNPLYVDAVVSNPPYSQKWDNDHKDTDPRYSRFGLAPKTKADYAFLLHDLFHLKPDGIMTIILPHGVLFRGGSEGTIRKKLIENNNIDTIIGLPANVFFGTSIPTVILVLKQKRQNTDVLIVDASREFIKVGKNNKLSASNIKKITDTVISRKSTSKFAKLVSKEVIRENKYNLNIPRYVDSSPKSESWDIHASMFGGIPLKELNELGQYWQTFPALQDALFTKTSSEYVELKVDNIKIAINHNQDVRKFQKQFEIAFENFEKFLKEELIANVKTVKIQKEESILSENLFKRLASIDIIDRYEAYQILDDQWDIIQVDLEIIQTEGIESTTKVEPNMVTKKVKGKDKEVQDGWKGRIMPFKLVQATFLKQQLAELKEQESRYSEILVEFEEILNSLEEDEKESNLVNAGKDKFINAEVSKEAKQLQKEEKKNGSFETGSFEEKILKVAELITEEKELKKQIKKDQQELHLLTKQTIETFNLDQVYTLLELKWISPLVVSIAKLPDEVITALSNKLQALIGKYATTYAHVAEEIKETETELVSMIDQLTGNNFDMKGLNEFTSFLKGEQNG